MYITRTQKECKDFEIKYLMYLITLEISVLKQTNYLVLQNLLLLLD